MKVKRLDAKTLNYVHNHVPPRPYSYALTEMMDGSKATQIVDADDKPIAGFHRAYEHMLECTNAIHAAGIQPADVAVFVKAVRAWKEYKQSKTMLEEVKQNSAFESAIKTAAALLPERKESK